MTFNEVVMIVILFVAILALMLPAIVQLNQALKELTNVKQGKQRDVRNETEHL